MHNFTYLGSYLSASTEGRAVQLLHELAHLLKRVDDPNRNLYPLNNDSRNRTLSNINTRLILQKCAAAIDDIMIRREYFEYFNIPYPY